MGVVGATGSEYRVIEAYEAAGGGDEAIAPSVR
jgi:hypothetical protein